MQKLQFTIKIKAPKEQVWNTLWNDKTLRDWANIIDKGMYMTGDLKEGNEVQFISSVSGYGVTSLVEKLVLNELVSFKQIVDTKDSGKQEREEEWAGSAEKYELEEKNGMTNLTVKIDVPHGLEDIFKDRFPKALERVKVLTEKEK